MQGIEAKGLAQTVGRQGWRPRAPGGLYACLQKTFGETPLPPTELAKRESPVRIVSDYKVPLLY